jgi:hypothetical protein
MNVLSQQGGRENATNKDPTSMRTENNHNLDMETSTNECVLAVNGACKEEKKGLYLFLWR